MAQRLLDRKQVDIYDYDDRIKRVYKQMQNEISIINVKLIADYDKMMVSISLSKATRLRHLQTLLSLSRLVGIDWKEVTKREI